MTFKELRSQCLEGVQDYTAPLIPDKDGMIRKCVRDFLEKLGTGVQSTATITTAEDEREYGQSAGFPTDFMAMDTVFKTTTRIYPIARRQRNEASSNGTPSGYYLWANVTDFGIGFNVPCTASVGDITLNYYGKELDANMGEDTDIVLRRLPIVDDDPIWDAIIDKFALYYYGRELANCFQNDNPKKFMMIERLIARKEIDYKNSKAYAIQAIRSNSFDREVEKELPRDYFTLGRNTFIQRASNQGDLTYYY